MREVALPCVSLAAVHLGGSRAFPLPVKLGLLHYRRLVVKVADDYLLRLVGRRAVFCAGQRATN